MNDDELKGIRKAIRSVAENRGLSENEARAEMQKAIIEAYRNPDPEIQAVYREIFGDGVPSVEVFLFLLSKRL